MALWHRLHRRLAVCAGLMALASVGVSAAPSQPRIAIQKQYDRVSQAMRHRYVDGVLSVRTQTYRSYDPTGKLLNSSVEVKRMAEALHRVSHADEAVSILQFKLLTPTRAQVEIRDRMQLMFPGDLSAGKFPVMVVSRCVDTWVLTSAGWRLDTSHILTQTARRDPGYLAPPKVPK